MTSVATLMKNLGIDEPKKGEYNDDIVDLNYIRKSTQLINDALQKGFDIMQMPNGDITITEVKTISYKYNWNKERQKFERASTKSKQRKN